MSPAIQDSVSPAAMQARMMRVCTSSTSNGIVEPSARKIMIDVLLS